MDIYSNYNNIYEGAGGKKSSYKRPLPNFKAVFGLKFAHHNTLISPTASIIWQFFLKLPENKKPPPQCDGGKLL